MQQIITRAKMDAIVEGGCKIKGCNHHDDTMYLHSRCHVEAPLGVTRAEQYVVVHCVECSKIVFILSSSAEVPDVKMNDCCNEEIYWANYTKGSGIVKFTCYFCKSDVFHVVLSE